MRPKHRPPTLTGLHSPGKGPKIKAIRHSFGGLKSPRIPGILTPDGPEGKDEDYDYVIADEPLGGIDYLDAKLVQEIPEDDEPKL